MPGAGLAVVLPLHPGWLLVTGRMPIRLIRLRGGKRAPGWGEYQRQDQPDERNFPHEVII